MVRRPGRGPAPSAGTPGPAAEPSPGPPAGSRQVGWGGLALLDTLVPRVCGVVGLGGPPTPALALAARGILHHGDRGPQRGQVLTYQLPAEAAPQERYFLQLGEGQALILVLG